MRHQTPRAIVTLIFLALALGAGSGMAFAHSHTVGGIYEGINQEQRAGAGNDYHHAWTEHGHGCCRFVAIHANFSGSEWCRAGSTGQGTATHVHCTAYHENLGESYHATTAMDYCSADAHLVSSVYSDGHGICDHWWHTNTYPSAGWD